ncbi:hypothetical protein J3F84DRAFT_328808 [Trichoderma pleuroticola]
MEAMCKIRLIEIDRRAAEQLLASRTLCASFSRHCASIGKPTAETCLLSIPDSHHRNKDEEAEASIRVDWAFFTDRSRPKQTEQGLDSLNGLYSDTTHVRAGMLLYCHVSNMRFPWPITSIPCDEMSQSHSEPDRPTSSPEVITEPTV